MVIDLATTPTVTLNRRTAYRVVSAKFPPVDLFDDVASEQEFDAIFAIQALTNPRLQNEAGNVNLISKDEIPSGIDGCTYATAPFTHINPDGSRFSDGSYGVLYLADTIDTAIEESRFHQEKYFQNVSGMHYDSIIMRGLKFSFSATLVNICNINNVDVYHPSDYTVSRSLGRQIKEAKLEGLQYNSVRHLSAICWALFTPKKVKRIIQTAHYEFIYDGAAISHIRMISNIN